MVARAGWSEFGVATGPVRDERRISGQRRSALGHLQSPKTFMQLRTTSFLW